MALSSPQFNKYEKQALKQSKKDQEEAFEKRCKMFMKAIDNAHKIITKITGDEFCEIDFKYDNLIDQTVKSINNEMKKKFTKKNIKVKINNFKEFYVKWKNYQNRMLTPSHAGDCLWAPLIGKYRKFVNKAVNDIHGPNSEQRAALIYFTYIIGLHSILVGKITQTQSAPMPIIVYAVFTQSDEIQTEMIHYSLNMEEIIQTVEMRQRSTQKSNAKKIHINVKDVSNETKRNLQKQIRNCLPNICKLFDLDPQTIAETIDNYNKKFVVECVGKNTRNKKRYVNDAMIFGEAYKIQLAPLDVRNSNGMNLYAKSDNLETRSNVDVHVRLLNDCEIENKECARRVAELVQRFGRDNVLNQINLLEKNVNHRGRNRYNHNVQHCRGRSRSRSRDKNRNGNINNTHISSPQIQRPLYRNSVNSYNHNISTAYCYQYNNRFLFENSNNYSNSNHHMLSGSANNLPNIAQLCPSL
eukprot:245227_1